MHTVLCDLLDLDEEYMPYFEMSRILHTRLLAIRGDKGQSGRYLGVQYELEREKMGRHNVEQQREELVLREPRILDQLHRKRFESVLQGLVTACQERDPCVRRAGFLQTVETEVRSGVRPLGKRFKAEEARQKHSREVQDAL
jgi:hypothetical protein